MTVPEFRQKIDETITQNAKRLILGTKLNAVLNYAADTIESTVDAVLESAKSGRLGYAEFTSTAPVTGSYYYLVEDNKVGIFEDLKDANGNAITTTADDFYDGTDYYDVVIDVTEGVATKIKQKVSIDVERINKISTEISQNEIHKINDFTNCPNRFNRKDFKGYFQIDEGTGLEIPSNESNGLSGYIAVEEGMDFVIMNSMYYYNSNGNYKKLSLVNKIHCFDDEKRYISTIHNDLNANFTIPGGASYVRINPSINPGDTYFSDYADTLVLSRVDEIAFGYLPFGEKRKLMNPDYLFLKNMPLSDVVNFENGILSIPKNATVSSSSIFDNAFISENTGLGKSILKIELMTADRTVLPMLFQNMSIMTNISVAGGISEQPNANPLQPKIELFEDVNPNIFYVEITGQISTNNIIEVRFSKFMYDFKNNPGAAKISLYNGVVGDDGKPKGFIFGGDVTQAELSAVQNNLTAVQNQMPAIIDQQIGSSLNDYFTEHINDFDFNQPNYIEANSSFNLAGLTSSMNGKFISIIADIDLQGATLDFVDQNVKKLKLVFNGGRILNGKIRSNETKCIFLSNEAFANIEILNQFENDFARPEWFGANCDGLDGGMGNFRLDDSFAWNQALRFASHVRGIGNKTSIIKKPIIVNSGSKIELDNDFTVKLGDGANCTILKNKPIDFPNLGLEGLVTYPAGFVRDKNISIIGGTWDGNGRNQNRANNPSLGDRAEVLGTDRFSDGDGTPYQGWGFKFADIDGFTIENVTLKDARTYTLAMGGINGFSIKNIYIKRGYKFENNDGIHLHGKCFDGVVDNVYGMAGDDVFAITTHESNYRSIRVGDVKHIRLSRIHNYGMLNENTDNEVYPTDGLVPTTSVYRPIRLTYTAHVIDDIHISGLTSTNPNFLSSVVCSYLPHEQITTKGKIGSITIDGFLNRDAYAAVDIGASTTVDVLRMQNFTIEAKRSDNECVLIKQLEKWTDNETYEASQVGTVFIENVHIKRSIPTNNGENGLISYQGTINNLIINKLIIEDDVTALRSFNCLLYGNFNFVQISNSKIAVKKLINGNVKHLNENNNDFGYYEFGVYKNITDIGGTPKRMNSNSILTTSYPSNPRFGDSILTSHGNIIYLNGWQTPIY